LEKSKLYENCSQAISFITFTAWLLTVAIFTASISIPVSAQSSLINDDAVSDQIETEEVPTHRKVYQKMQKETSLEDAAMTLSHRRHLS
jgi:hypothetical protein